MVDIWLRSDKENYLTGAAYDGADYLSPEQSCCELAIFIYVCDSPTGKVCNWFDNVWELVPFTPRMSVVEYDLPGGQFRCYADGLDLALLDSKESVDREIAALRERVKEKLSIEI